MEKQTKLIKDKHLGIIEGFKNQFKDMIATAPNLIYPVRRFNNKMENETAQELVESVEEQEQPFVNSFIPTEERVQQVERDFTELDPFNSLSFENPFENFDIGI